MRAGRPQAVRCAITREGHSWLQWPSRAESDAARPRPTAAAWPWFAQDNSPNTAQILLMDDVDQDRVEAYVVFQ
jgi:hypothetical protein